MKKEDLLTALAKFDKTETYHRVHEGLFLTDGASYLAEKAGASWLIDIIRSLLPYLKPYPFAVLRMQVNEDRSAYLVVEDSNAGPIYTQDVDHTDFPLDKIQLYIADLDEKSKVVMLPTEH